MNFILKNSYFTMKFLCITILLILSELRDITRSSLKKKSADSFDEFSVRMLPGGEENVEIKSIKRRKKESVRMNIV